MKTGYKGEQPFDVWLKHWQTNTCEMLPKMSPTNVTNPLRNVTAITRIARHYIDLDADWKFTDLKDLVKTECSRRNLAYDAEVIAAALDAATRERRLL